MGRSSSAVARHATGIAISGFGRIGRQVARIALKDLEEASLHTRDTAEIPFAEHGVEYVCESTGVFLTTEKIQPYLKAGAKKVALSAPAKDDSYSVVMGVIRDTYGSSMAAVSCAPCTTNGL